MAQASQLGLSFEINRYMARQNHQPLTNFSEKKRYEEVVRAYFAVDKLS